MGARCFVSITKITDGHNKFSDANITEATSDFRWRAMMMKRALPLALSLSKHKMILLECLYFGPCRLGVRFRVGVRARVFSFLR